MGLLPMDMDILPPSDDRIFKLILAPDEAEPVRIDLISAILKRPVVSAKVRNSEIPPEDTQEKAERLDVNCRIDDGTQVDLEMQASRIQEDFGGGHQNLKGKSIYYLCDLHSSQPSKGIRRYDKLARTYQVTFCSYNVFPGRTQFVNSFSMRHDEDNELLSEAIHIVYVELNKLQEIIKKPTKDMTDLEKWSIFFHFADELAQREKVNQVIESKEALQMAGEQLMSISKDERERAILRSRKMYQTDYQSDMATSWDNGVKEGEQRGKHMKALEIARSALRKKMSIDDIVDITGLSRVEVESLCEKM